MLCIFYTIIALVRLSDVDGELFYCTPPADGGDYPLAFETAESIVKGSQFIGATAVWQVALAYLQDDGLTKGKRANRQVGRSLSAWLEVVTR